jgi:hypothetical protein
MAVVAAAVLVAVPAASATSASLVTGRQIRDGSVTGADVRDGSIAAHEFGHLVPGSVGPVGPEGPQGPQGPQGPAGLSGWTTVVSQVGVPVPAGKSASTEVDCAAPRLAVGGGVSASIPDSARVSESAPADLLGTGWYVTVRNVGAGPISIAAWATCVSR